MMIYYSVYDDFWKPGYIDGNLDRFVVDYLFELINDDQNGVVTVFFSID